MQRAVEREEMVRQVWLRCGGRCQCAEVSHGHPARCGRSLVWAHRGLAPRGGAWQARVEAVGTVAERIEVLCGDCYIRTERPRALTLARAA